MKAQATASMPPASQPAMDLEEIFRDHHAMVFRAAYRITGNAGDAEDAMQTVFLRMLKRDAAAEPVTNMASFLRRAAINAALDLVRARQNIRGVPLEDLEPVLADAPHRQPDQARKEGEVREWLRGALARLNPRSAAMFALRFFEDKENPEIARLLDTTPGTVAVTLSRTRDWLEKEYRVYVGGVA